VLGGAAGKFIYFDCDFIQKGSGRHGLGILCYFQEAVKPEYFFVLVHGFDNTVGIQNNFIARFKVKRSFFIPMGSSVNPD